MVLWNGRGGKNAPAVICKSKGEKKMLNELKNEANRAYTENGALTNKTTQSDCLDLFATIGALRRQSEDEIIVRFTRAFGENRDLAVKTLFYARDVRGGLGERRVFRVIVGWLAQNEPAVLKKNIKYFAEYGRFDDLLCLLHTKCEDEALRVIKEQLDMDRSCLKNGENVSLLAKWLPSENTSSKAARENARYLMQKLGYTERCYRKTMVALRNRIRIIENNLRERDYTFDYAKQPSRAMKKYRAAFYRNDEKRYTEFLQKVSSGEAKLHAGTLYPYELVLPYIHDRFWGAGRSFMREITEEEKQYLNATWKSLPHFGSDENALAVIDTSGSMYWNDPPLPAAVALSLGLYFAEHNKGVFHNHFIEFSEEPTLVEIKGETFADKLRFACSFNKIGNTDLEAVFDLVLNAAVRHNVPQKELPKKLVIISDMEFDSCIYNADATNFDNAKQKYAAHGYDLPEIVFWNVESRSRNLPVTMNENGAALVSGCTPRIFQMVEGDLSTPYALMLEILSAERYKKISA